MVEPFRPEDLYQYAKITDVHCAYAQNIAACSVTTVDQSNDASTSAIWLFPIDGGPPRPMTSGGSNDTTPRWSPDGGQLCFISDRAGANQLFLIPRDGGEARQLSDFPGPVIAAEWSPQGDRILAICSLQVDPNLRGERPPPDTPPPSGAGPHVVWKLPYKADGVGYVLDREAHLFILEVASGESTQLTDGAFDVRSANWSPEGREIMYTRTREGDESHRSDVWSIELETKAARQLTCEQGQVLNPVCSPDGRWIVFSGTAAEGDAQVRPWTIELETGAVAPLGDDSIEISTEGQSLQFSRHDATRVFAVVAYRGLHEVVTIALPQGAIHRLVLGDRQPASLALSENYMAFSSETPITPQALYGCRHDGTEERRLSHFNDWWDERTPATLERRCFTVPDGEGGSETISGWLIRSRDAVGPAPLLVDVHGGPASHVLFDYHATTYWSVLWSAGWSILALDAVGSASYGRQFADRLRGRWGELDLPQQLAAVEALRADNIADERVAICGKSYGGYLSAWAAGHTDVFKAAVVMAPVTDMVAHWGTSDSGYYSDPYALGGEFFDVLALAQRLSPIEHVRGATTPTLILQGEDDERCPRGQGESLYVLMKQYADAPCELVLYPETGHTLTTEAKPSYRVDVVQRIVGWLARWAASNPT